MVVVAKQGRGWLYSPENSFKFKAKMRREHDSQAVMAAVPHPPQPLLLPPPLCQDNVMLYTLIHLPGGNDNGDGGGDRCHIYVSQAWSAASPVRRIRVGLPSPGLRLALFVI
jgi:hypothetical protein